MATLTFRLIRDSQIRTTLLLAILQMQVHRESYQMRGMQRLANVMHSGLQEMDDEAGKVADEFVAAKTESEQVIAGFKAHVGDIRAATAEVRALLGQLTNSPLPDTAASSVAPVPPQAN